MLVRLSVFLTVAALAACAGPAARRGTKSGVAPGSTAAGALATPGASGDRAPKQALAPVASSPASGAASSKAAAPAPSAFDPREIERARALVDQGVRLYRQGDYGQAEELLKQAITIYPFMAEANLVLGKILLIRASASKDVALLTNARLMLEMARALDPGSRETVLLLELFQQPTAE